MQPTSWLQRQALLHPQRPAFFWNEESWSFSLLAQMAQRYAHYYAAVLPSDVKRVAVSSRNHPAFYWTILGLWELGIEIQFLNSRLTVAERHVQLTDAQSRYLLVDQVTAYQDEWPLLEIPPQLTTEISPQHYMDRGYHLAAIASIMYTSGTTGRPKGVPQTFAHHLASAQATRVSLDVQGTSCWGLALPLFHISGLSILLRSMALGNAVYLMEKPLVHQLDHALRTGQVTILSVVTRVLQELVTIAPANGYPTVQTILLGGGPVDQETLEQAAAKALPVMQSFGMTETCSQIIALPMTEALRKIGSAGYPLQGVQVKVVPLRPEDSVGEIYVKGPSVVSHYLHQQTREQWTEDGWFKTGDLGYLDTAGALYVKSRLSELIISGGENIYPAELEQAFLQHPFIEEAAVVGQADDQWGQVPIAFIRTTQPLTATIIREHLQRYLAKYKQPKIIYLVHELPRTASGKLLKRVLLTEERVKYIDYQLGN